MSTKIANRTQFLLILVGKAGVGKTAIRRRLAELLDAEDIGPDDHPHRWDWAIRKLDRTPRVVLECCKVPRAVRYRMEYIPDVTVVELTVPDEIRRQRLFKQGHDPEEIARRLREFGGYGYQDPLVPDFSSTTDAPPDDVADAIAETLRRRAPEKDLPSHEMSTCTGDPMTCRCCALRCEKAADFPERIKPA